MSLTKVNYIDNSTIITAQNLNDIQDNIIQNAELIQKAQDEVIQNAELIKSAAPRNLLDNSDFKIAQAGYMGLHGNTTYVADRWISNGITSASMGSNGIVLSSGIQYGRCQQKLEGMSGKTVTFAVKGSSSGRFRISIYDSEISTEYAYAFLASGINTCTCTIPTDMDIICLLIYPDNDNATGNATIEWAALYEGEYTADNLPVYQPKGYAAELLECARYFTYLWDFSKWIPVSRVGNYAFISLSTPVPMRVTPSINTVTWRMYGPKLVWFDVTAPDTVRLSGTNVTIPWGSSSVSSWTDASLNGNYFTSVSASLYLTADL